MSAAFASTIGVMAAGLSMSSFVPQILKILHEQDAEGVSTGMYLATVAGFIAWIVYGLMIRSWPLAGSNLINLALAGTVLLLKQRGKARRPDQGRDR